MIQIDRRAHKVQVSIKALEVAEEKEAIAQYGSSDPGATLGDILGTAQTRHREAGREDGVAAAKIDWFVPATAVTSGGGNCPARVIEGDKPSSLDADTIVDRRRMRRKITFWRGARSPPGDRRGSRHRRGAEGAGNGHARTERPGARLRASPSAV